jgi:phosphatidylglycerophosphate synthase
MVKIKRHYGTLTYSTEKRILDSIASKIYTYFHADFYTLIAFLSSLLVSSSFIIASNNIGWLYLGVLGIILHWFGDSLDGRIARLREQARPLYGHYMDHIFDEVNMTIMLIAVSYSTLTLTNVWIYVLVVTLLIFSHVHLLTSVTQQFNLSVSSLGGTETRIVFIILLIITAITGNPTLYLLNKKMTFVDAAGYFFLLVTTFLFLHHVSSALWGKNKVRD